MPAGSLGQAGDQEVGGWVERGRPRGKRGAPSGGTQRQAAVSQGAMAPSAGGCRSRSRWAPSVIAANIDVDARSASSAGPGRTSPYPAAHGIAVADQVSVELGGIGRRSPRRSRSRRVVRSRRLPRGAVERPSCGVLVANDVPPGSSGPPASSSSSLAGSTGTSRCSSTGARHARVGAAFGTVPSVRRLRRSCPPDAPADTRRGPRRPWATLALPAPGHASPQHDPETREP